MDSQGGVSAEGPMILDGDGELVWFRTVSANPQSVIARAFNLRVQQWKGKPVLTWFDGSVLDGHGQGVDVIMDATYTEIARVQAYGYSDDLHDFVITPQGTAFVTCYPLGYGDLRSVGGSSNGAYVYGVVQEIDIESGEVLFTWRSDEHIAFDESYSRIADYRTSPYDYIHLNSICVAADGNLIFSGRNTWSFFKVDRSTGEVLWRLGGKRSDFTIEPRARFAWQHDVSEDPEGTFTVFDNGAGDYRTQDVSRGLILDVDEKTRRVTLARELLHPRTPLQAGSLGSVQSLADGHTFVGWGLLAGFSEFDADGRALLDGRLDGNDVQSYRAFRSEWTGTPTDAPALVVERAGKAMNLFTSWNGATQVAHWLVLGGAHPSALASIGVAPKAGFETIIEVPRSTAYVAVAALDARGSEIGRSSPVPV